MGTVSRAEYLKKYTTNSSEKPETEKSTNLLECQENAQLYEQGRNVETRKRVTGFNRGRKGKREEENSEEKEAREAKQAEMEKKYSLWSKGLTQIKEREEKLDEMEQILGEGFTRHKDDEALNEHLKTQLHSEDPMAEYFRVKNHKIQMRTGI
uniref:BUD13 homolog n=1 Tax=Meloidogyne javanica TaxID=6303 RepID=A0A915LN31_MELJA